MNAAAEPWVRQARGVEDCGSMVRVFRCEGCGKWAAMEDSCKVRVCPACFPRLRQRNVAKVEDLIGKRGPLRFVTLTERSGPELESMLDRVLSDFRRLRSRIWWKGHVSGGVYAVEITWGEAGWHVHLHMIVLGVFLPRPELVSEWQAAAGCRCARRVREGKPILCCRSTWEDRGEQFARCSDPRCACAGCPVEPAGQDVRQARKGAVRELCKYIAKDLGSQGGMLADRAALKAFLLATRSRRMLSAFGSLHGRLIDSKDDREHACPDCGGQMVYRGRMHEAEFESCYGSRAPPSSTPLRSPRQAGGPPNSSGPKAQGGRGVLLGSRPAR